MDKMLPQCVLIISRRNQSNLDAGASEKSLCGTDLYHILPQPLTCPLGTTACSFPSLHHGSLCAHADGKVDVIFILSITRPHLLSKLCVSGSRTVPAIVNWERNGGSPRLMPSVRYYAKAEYTQNAFHILADRKTNAQKY